MKIRIHLFVALVLCLNLFNSAKSAVSTTETNVPVELTFTAQVKHDDPFNTVTLDVLFDEPGNTVRRVPAFWDGGQIWKAAVRVDRNRQRPPLRSECSDTSDAGLHGVSGDVEISKVQGRKSALLAWLPGPGRGLQATFRNTLDGTPFFWLWATPGGWVSRIGSTGPKTSNN